MKLNVNKSENDNDILISREEYDKKIYDLTQLMEICKGLNSSLIDFNKLIDSILLTCMGQMQLIKAGIFLKKGIDENIFILHRNYKGFELNHRVEYSLEGDSNLIDFLENNFRCYEMQELVDIYGNDADVAVLQEVSPCLIVPLKGKDKLNGIIVLGERINNDKFSADEKEYLMHIASLAGIAIHNAFLYELATTDMMTKLKMYHFFQTSLLDEMGKAARNKKNLSMIMMDIDNFKVFNDNYGHICGDTVLKYVGKMILEKIRQIDIAARYGGEEFALILPETDIEEAYRIAERIRTGVEEMKFMYNGEDISITVSAGIAQFNPETDNNKQSLVDRADKAMYLSKESGKNMTTAL